MSLDMLPATPPDAGSSRSTGGRARARVALLERDLPPLPTLLEDDPGDQDDAPAAPDGEQDAELAEFIAFFTGERRAITLEASAPTESPAPELAPLGRVRRVTERVARVATLRPVAQIPQLPHVARSLRARVIDAARPVREIEIDETEAQQEQARARRTITLPPVWVMVNLAIVAALVFGFLPQIITVSAAAGCKWYRVQPGDTLWKLSKANGVSISDLANANHIQNINLIYVDQQMCIPLMPLASSDQPAPAPPASAPIYSAPANVRAFVSYTLPYARQASSATGWPVSMILAQWGLETGWRIKTFTGYNWGNCGAMPNEPMVGGTSAPGSPAAFAYAYSPAQGVAEYVHVARLGYYRHVAQAAGSGADAAARALGQSPWDWGHYTNRGDPGSSLISIMRVFNLYYYDTH